MTAVRLSVGSWHGCPLTYRRLCDIARRWCLRSQCIALTWHAPEVRGHVHVRRLCWPSTLTRGASGCHSRTNLARRAFVRGNNGRCHCGNLPAVCSESVVELADGGCSPESLRHRRRGRALLLWAGHLPFAIAVFVGLPTCLRLSFSWACPRVCDHRCRERALSCLRSSSLWVRRAQGHL